MKTNQIYRIALAVFVLQFTVLLATAQSTVAYLTITGSKSGQIKGSSTLRGAEGSIECVGYSYALKNAVSIGSATGGAGVGKAEPISIQIVKHYDESSSQIMQAMTTDEMLTSVVLTIYKQSAGQMVQVEKVEFSGAVISGITQFAGVGSGQANLLPDEEVFITAAKVSITGSTQSANGTVKATPTATYDLKANKRQ